ncbi:MAG: carbohydrate kinase family protein [Anaerolineales bacterium]|nr:carbohydrate kinase family protein [Anaerolineales bacterium]
MVGWLNTANVDLRHLIHRLNASTSTTTIVIDDERNRLSFHHPGAYATYSMRDLPENWTHGVSTVVVASYPLMGGLRPYGVRKIMAIARAAGIRTALDIGPAIGDLTTVDELRPLLPDVDYLLANEHELLVLTGESDAPAQIACWRTRPGQTRSLRREARGCRVERRRKPHSAGLFRRCSARWVRAMFSMRAF